MARGFIKKYGTRIQGSCGEGTADGTTIDGRIIRKRAPCEEGCR